MKSKKASDWIQYGLAVVAIVFINIIGSQFFYRLDLTEDKRYTITPATKTLLNKLNDVVYVEVYLEGDFPAAFKILQSSIRETLEEFRAYGGENIQFKFINPSADPDQKARTELYNQLAKRGLQPTNLYEGGEDNRVQKIIFPGAIVSYGGKEAAVTLLKGNQAASAVERLNQSAEGVEYELASAIKKLINPTKKRIAVLQGNGELNGRQMYDFGMALKDFYQVEPVNLRTTLDLSSYDAIIVAKPDTAFLEPDKFKIDQFIVGGGKALFLLDPIQMEMDSIKQEGSLVIGNDVNLTDMMFRYGVRVNNDLLMDLSSAYIPLVVGYMGDKPQTQLVQWRYFPLISTFGNSPIVKNLDAIYTKFASTIDTVKAAGIKKTPLLLSSKYARIIAAPVRLSFNEARLKPLPEQYQKSDIPIAYLLEGKFQSLFTNRLPPEAQTNLKFKAEDKPSKIIVCSDGDIASNEITKNGQRYLLGYDRFSGVQFGNKEFLMNAMSYLLDDDGVILARAKEIQVRPLDKPRIEKEKLNWQILNMALPALVVAVFGLLRFYRRKRRYTRN